MDISSDAADDERVIDLVSLFDVSPDLFAFREPIPQQILTRRARMSDLLIFDILLASGGVRNPSSLYPPNDASGLHILVLAIENSSYDSLKKDCLVYFLLKWHRDERAKLFSEGRSIPPQFVALADAYWSLDCGMDVPRAITLLADARLNRDYTSKILQAISLSHNAGPLIRRYIRTAKPILAEPDDVDTYALALADSNFFEAWQYQQTFSEGKTRHRILNKLLRWCLTPKPRPQPIKQLLGYSFSTYEQVVVHTFSVRPPSDIPSASVTAIQDLVCLRLVLGGQITAAVKLNRQFPLANSNEGRRAAQERKQHMLDEAVALMPAAERHSLEVELECSSQNGDMSASGSSELWNSAVNLSMSMSWEQIPAQPQATSAPPKYGRTSDMLMQNPATPIPKKANAPKFGGSLSALANATGASSSFVLGRSPATSQIVGVSPIASSSRVRSLAAKFQNTPPERPGESLYDTAGSANLKRNAFYEPSISAGSKRTFAQDSSRPNSYGVASLALPPAEISTASASSVVQELMRDEQVDVSMAPSDDGQDAREHQTELAAIFESEPDVEDNITLASQSYQSRMKADEDEDPRELNFSLFSSVDSSRPPKPAQTETEKKMPPGAFYTDVDEDSEAARPRPSPISRPHKAEPKQPLEPSISARRSRLQDQPLARSRKSVQPQDLGRSLPGSLMNDTDDEQQQPQQDEEEDVVTPLPPISTGSSSRRHTARKSRSSKGASAEQYREKDTSARPTRRSSRLSVVSASSRGSSSPEPPASSVKRRSARASVATPKKKAAPKQR